MQIRANIILHKGLCVIHFVIRENMKNTDDYTVPLSTAIRFQTEDRTRAIGQSMKRSNEDNLSQWVRDCIDLRLYLEQRGFTPGFVLSGDLLQIIETANSPSTQEKSEASLSPLNTLNEGNVEQIIKMILRNHAMTKKVLEIIADNPNVNTDPSVRYEDIVNNIQSSVNNFYDKVFKDNM